MRGILAGKGGRCELVSNLPLPVPTSASQVLIKVHATALNRADTLQRRGAYPPPPGVTPVLGLELAGTIQPGNEPVMALVSGGAFAEYCLAERSACMPIPTNVPMRTAASLPEAWLTAFQLLHLVGKIHSEDVVLIHAGASGVGTAAIQLAKKVFHCQHVYATTSQGKLELCEKLGASHCVDRNALAWNLPKPVSLLLDCVGGGDYVQKNCDALGMDARWVLFGLMDPTPGRAELIMRQVLRKRISLTGSTLRARTDEYKAELVREFTKMGCLDKFANGELVPVLDDKSFVGLESIDQALDYMETNQSRGKIVVEI